MGRNLLWRKTLKQKLLVIKVKSKKIKVLSIFALFLSVFGPHFLFSQEKTKDSTGEITEKEEKIEKSVETLSSEEKGIIYPEPKRKRVSLVGSDHSLTKKEREKLLTPSGRAWLALALENSLPYR